MTKKDLLGGLRDMLSESFYDQEKARDGAEALLIEYIGDEEVTKAFSDVINHF